MHFSDISLFYIKGCNFQSVFIAKCRFGHIVVLIYTTTFSWGDLVLRFFFFISIQFIQFNEVYKNHIIIFYLKTFNLESNTVYN